MGTRWKALSLLVVVLFSVGVCAQQVSEEKALIDKVNLDLATKLTFSKDEKLLDRFHTAAKVVVAVCNSATTPFVFHLVVSSAFQAESVGDHIYVTDTMVEYLLGDELVFVLGHEVWHAEAGDSEKKVKEIKRLRSRVSLQDFLGRMYPGGSSVRKGTDLKRFIEGLEQEADDGSLEYGIRAGANPIHLLGLLTFIRHFENRDYHERRVARMREKVLTSEQNLLLKELCTIKTVSAQLIFDGDDAQSAALDLRKAFMDTMKKELRTDVSLHTNGAAPTDGELQIRLKVLSSVSPGGAPNAMLLWEERTKLDGEWRTRHSTVRLLSKEGTITADLLKQVTEEFRSQAQRISRSFNRPLAALATRVGAYVEGGVVTYHYVALDVKDEYQPQPDQPAVVFSDTGVRVGYGKFINQPSFKLAQGELKPGYILVLLP